MNHHPTTESNGQVTDAARALNESVATVKQLLATGLLDPTALGLSTPWTDPATTPAPADESRCRTPTAATAATRVPASLRVACPSGPNSTR